MKNKLEMAAEECAAVNIHAMYGPNAASQISDNIEYDIIVESFITGAQWQLDNMWISIEDPPKDNRFVIVTATDYNRNLFYFISQYQNSRWQISNKYTILAWMEIPKFTKRK